MSGSLDLNQVTILGTLGADPEVRETHGGARVAQLSVGTTRRWKTGREIEEKTEWHRVVAWNVPRGPQFAEICERHAKRGDTVLVTGRVEYRQYVDKDKVERFVTEIVASEVMILGKVSRAAKAS